MLLGRMFATRPGLLASLQTERSDANRTGLLAKSYERSVRTRTERNNTRSDRREGDDEPRESIRRAAKTNASVVPSIGRTSRCPWRTSQTSMGFGQTERHPCSSVVEGRSSGKPLHMKTCCWASCCPKPTPPRLLIPMLGAVPQQDHGISGLLGHTLHLPASAGLNGLGAAKGAGRCCDWALHPPLSYSI